MEQSSQIKILEEQIRECYGRVVWSHKTHEKCADILNKRNSRIKMWQIILSAVTTSSIIFNVLGESKNAAVFAALVSVVLLILNTYFKKYDLGGLAQKHANAASSLWNIRESYLSLLTDLKAEIIDVKDICKARDNLQSNLHKVYTGSPRTINKAYNQASKALKEMEELTFSEEEIDKFLPNALKRTA
jgi:hypothetical protein